MEHEYFFSLYKMVARKYTGTYYSKGFIYNYTNGIKTKIKEKITIKCLLKNVYSIRIESAEINIELFGFYDEHTKCLISNTHPDNNINSYSIFYYKGNTLCERFSNRNTTNQNESVIGCLKLKRKCLH